MNDSPRRLIDVSWRTIGRLFAAAILVWLWLRLWHWVLLLVVAAFLAAALDPVVRWLEAHRVRRGIAAPILVLLLAAAAVGFLYFAGASMAEQGRMLQDRIGEFQSTVSRHIPPAVQSLIPTPEGAGSRLGHQAARVGRALLSGLVSIGIALILTVYLLLDGRRTYEWLRAFFSQRNQARLDETAIEARKATVAYVRGNVITSVLAGVFTFVMLTALGVPAALLLSVLAAVCDLVPVIGFFISTIPAVLLALTVSPVAGILVAVLNLAYNAVETYYIGPKVYGRALRLSDLAVILAFAVGAELAGVVGALIALPLVAIYPAVERIWLSDRLGREAVVEHRRIESENEH